MRSVEPVSRPHWRAEIKGLTQPWGPGMGHSPSDISGPVLASTLHEWIDIVVAGGPSYLVWAALASLPVWTYLVWSWPKPFLPGKRAAGRALEHPV